MQELWKRFRPSATMAQSIYGPKQNYENLKRNKMTDLIARQERNGTHYAVYLDRDYTTSDEKEQFEIQGEYLIPFVVAISKPCKCCGVFNDSEYLCGIVAETVFDAIDSYINVMGA